MVQAIGVDIGGSNLRVARIAPDGRLSGRASAAVSRVPEAAVAQILERCHELDDPSVSSVGIGIPGRVDVTRRKILSGGYVDLAGTNLVARLEAALGKPVAVGNDCGMALAAEMTLGAAQGHRNVVMFTIGTGIGGAVAMGGQVVHGAGTAGQLGHITVAQGGPPCNCGRCGCVETLSSGTALGLHIAEAGLPAGTRVEELLRAADAGEPLAMAVLKRWIEPLRSAIDSMVAAAAPELVLLGGGLGAAAHRALNHAPALSPWYQCPVQAARLGDEAGVIGAGLVALAAAG